MFRPVGLAAAKLADVPLHQGLMLAHLLAYRRNVLLAGNLQGTESLTQRLQALQDVVVELNMALRTCLGQLGDVRTDGHLVGEPLDGRAQVRRLPDAGVPLVVLVLHPGRPLILEESGELRPHVALRAQRLRHHALDLRAVRALPQHLVRQGLHLRPELVEGLVDGVEGLLGRLLLPRVQLLVHPDALIPLLLDEGGQAVDVAGTLLALDLQGVLGPRVGGRLPHGRQLAEGHLDRARDLLVLAVQLHHALTVVAGGQSRLEVLTKQHCIALLLLLEAAEMLHNLPLQLLKLRAVLPMIRAEHVDLVAEFRQLCLQLHVPLARLAVLRLVAGDDRVQPLPELLVQRVEVLVLLVLRLDRALVGLVLVLHLLHVGVDIAQRVEKVVLPLVLPNMGIQLHEVFVHGVHVAPHVLDVGLYVGKALLALARDHAHGVQRLVDLLLDELLQHADLERVRLLHRADEHVPLRVGLRPDVLMRGAHRHSRHALLAYGAHVQDLCRGGWQGLEGQEVGLHRVDGSRLHRWHGLGLKPRLLHGNDPRLEAALRDRLSGGDHAGGGRGRHQASRWSGHQSLRWHGG
mmetsp:Transcript_84608/g.262802  ORF Transcript_84608/g.262802 Transcript_84608/m.262802 type:complete len:576 (+) Transcript_84608:881-2608(+)